MGNRVHKKKKIKKSILIIIILFVVIGLGFLGYNMFKSDFRIKGFNKIVEINYKSKYKNNYGKICYGNVFSCDKVKVTSKGKVDTSKLGKYKVSYTLKIGNNTKKITQVVEVVDKEKPKLTIEDKIAYVCPNNNKVQDLKIKATDNYDGDLTKKVKTEYKDDKVIISVKDSSGNETKKELTAKKEDKVAPVITINGQKNMYLQLNGTYNDEGATAVDNCDGEVKVEMKNTINANEIGTYAVTYSAKDSSNNEAKEEREVKVFKNEDGYRTVYLTFDDGPSEYTYKLLDTLKQYNVKVTFFVTGNGSDDAIRRAYNEGHTIALHTNTHRYEYLYASVDNYFEDLYAVQARVERITGYKSNLIRFPGGSSNMVSDISMSYLTEEVQRRGFKYFDWNVSSGDAGSASTADEVYNNVISTLKEGSSIVLQHDVKGFSVDAVGRIIEYGLSNGYTFKPLTETSPGAHHGTNS